VRDHGVRFGFVRGVSVDCVRGQRFGSGDGSRFGSGVSPRDWGGTMIARTVSYYREMFRTVGGGWSRVRAVGPDDVSPVTRVSRLGCDYCYLNIAHTVALCENEVAR